MKTIISENSGVDYGLYTIHANRPQPRTNNIALFICQILNISIELVSTILCINMDGNERLNVGEPTLKRVYHLLNCSTVEPLDTNDGSSLPVSTCPSRPIGLHC